MFCACLPISVDVSPDVHRYVTGKCHSNSPHIHIPHSSLTHIPHSYPSHTSHPTLIPHTSHPTLTPHTHPSHLCTHPQTTQPLPHMLLQTLTCTYMHTHTGHICTGQELDPRAPAPGQPQHCDCTLREQGGPGQQEGGRL